MGLRRDWWNERAGEWVDRVAATDDPMDGACPDFEQLLSDAAEYGRIAVECCVEPLRQILADLPRIISIEVEHRHGQHAWKWDIQRGG